MARMAMGSKKRVRRCFTEEFNAGAVPLVLDEGKTVSQVGRDLDVSQSVVGTG
jgi:transposase